MPNPIKEESLSSYMSKFMGSGEARKSFPKKAQRAAVAYSKFRKRKGK